MLTEKLLKLDKENTEKMLQSLTEELTKNISIGNITKSKNLISYFG